MTDGVECAAKDVTPDTNDVAKAIPRHTTVMRSVTQRCTMLMVTM